MRLRDGDVVIVSRNSCSKLDSSCASEGERHGKKGRERGRNLIVNGVSYSLPDSRECSGYVTCRLYVFIRTERDRSAT